jgi:hypothetical protein
MYFYDRVKDIFKGKNIRDLNIEIVKYPYIPEKISAYNI